MINTLSEVIRLDLIKENILSEIVCNYLILYIYIYIQEHNVYNKLCQIYGQRINYTQTVCTILWI